jgi:hypothetical protein
MLSAEENESLFSPQPKGGFDGGENLEKDSQKSAFSLYIRGSA